MIATSEPFGIVLPFLSPTLKQSAGRQSENTQVDHTVNMDIIREDILPFLGPLFFRTIE